jgi:hypothetical protein
MAADIATGLAQMMRTFRDLMSMGLLIDSG